jgi:hypothetical protein
MKIITFRKNLFIGILTLLIGSFVVWTMSANPGDAGGANLDTSGAEFDAITEPTIEVISPNGGEVWTAGSSQDIIWRSQAWEIYYATLLYSTDSGTTYSDTIAANLSDPHNPGDPETTSYTWTVPPLTSSTVRVKAEGLDKDYLLLDWDESDANFTINQPGVEGQDASDLPRAFSLSQNYPNPFNPITEIRYTLPKDSYVKLEIYNILGHKVATFMGGKHKAGYQVARWDGSSYSSGIYFYRLQVGDFVQTRKMILLK